MGLKTDFKIEVESIFITQRDRLCRAFIRKKGKPTGSEGDGAVTGKHKSSVTKTQVSAPTHKAIRTSKKVEVL